METEPEFLDTIGANSLHDYIYHAKYGLVPVHGALIDKLGYYDTLKEFNGGPECKISFFSMDSMDLMIRFPLTGFMCIIGIIIGIKGFLFFRKYSFKFSVAFIFYASMNTNGLILHSLMPITDQRRWIFALGDKGSTGVSGLFLALGLISIMNKKSSHESSSSKLKFIALICVMFLLCNIPFLDDFIYIFGCDAVFYAGIKIFMFAKKGNKISQYLVRIGQWTLIILVAILLLAISNTYLCKYKNYLNLMSGFFAICNIGFVVIYHYIAKYYSKNKKQQKKEK
eukprot:372313_1